MGSTLILPAVGSSALVRKCSAHENLQRLSGMERGHSLDSLFGRIHCFHITNSLTLLSYLVCHYKI